MLDLGLSADERKAYNYLYSQADKEDLGVLTGDKAVAFFEGAGLPGQVSSSERYASRNDGTACSQALRSEPAGPNTFTKHSVAGADLLLLARPAFCRLSARSGLFLTTRIPAFSQKKHSLEHADL